MTCGGSPIHPCGATHRHRSGGVGPPGTRGQVPTQASSCAWGVRDPSGVDARTGRGLTLGARPGVQGTGDGERSAPLGALGRRQPRASEARRRPGACGPPRPTGGAPARPRRDVGGLKARTGPRAGRAGAAASRPRAAMGPARRAGAAHTRRGPAVGLAHGHVSPRPMASESEPRAGDGAAPALLRRARPAQPGRRLTQPLPPPNRRIRDPYVRWCGRGAVVRPPPIPIRAQVI